MANSKINLNNDTLIDITQDTVTANDCYSIATAIGKNGTHVTGTIRYPLLEDDIIQRTISGQYVNDRIIKLKGYAFNGCDQLTKVHFKSASFNGYNIFKQCSNLKIFVCEDPITYLNNSYYVFGACSNLEYLDFNISQLKQQMFISSGDYSLHTLILRKSDAITTLESNIITNSCQAFKQNGTGGTIYIPKVLYDHLGDGTSLDYKSATNWSTVDGYGTITWAQIQGSQYETYYADGTPISTT